MCSLSWHLTIVMSSVQIILTPSSLLLLRLWRMEVPYVFSALFVLTMSAAAVHVQSSLSHDGISLVRRKRVAKANSTCTTQKLLQRYSPIGAILKSQEGKNKNFFNVREEAVFVCKNDYRKIGQLPSFICQEDSTWKEYSTNQTGKN